jgi:hypothetical protein
VKGGGRELTHMHACQPASPGHTTLPQLTGCCIAYTHYLAHLLTRPPTHPPGFVALAQGSAALLPGATQYWLTTPLQLGCRQSQ